MLRRRHKGPSRRVWHSLQHLALRKVLLAGFVIALLGLWLASLDGRRDIIVPPPVPSSETISPRSLVVVDGDTVRLNGQPIRLIGFDTPETYRAQCDGERARGDAATARLQTLLDAAKSAVLVYEPRGDQYGRRLARLKIDGEDVGDLLVGEGLARRYAGGLRLGWC